MEREKSTGWVHTESLPFHSSGHLSILSCFGKTNIIAASTPFSSLYPRKELCLPNWQQLLVLRKELLYLQYAASSILLCIGSGGRWTKRARLRIPTWKKIIGRSSKSVDLSRILWSNLISEALWGSECLFLFLIQFDLPQPWITLVRVSKSHLRSNEESPTRHISELVKCCRFL